MDPFTISLLLGGTALGAGMLSRPSAPSPATVTPPGIPSRLRRAFSNIYNIASGKTSVGVPQQEINRLIALHGQATDRQLLEQFNRANRLAGGLGLGPNPQRLLQSAIQNYLANVGLNRSLGAERQALQYSYLMPIQNQMRALGLVPQVAQTELGYSNLANADYLTNARNLMNTRMARYQTGLNTSNQLLGLGTELGGLGLQQYAASRQPTPPGLTQEQINTLFDALMSRAKQP